MVFDVMSDVLTYIDFNTSDQILPVFGLKTVLFHSMELLSSNHLELVTKLCPKVNSLSALSLYCSVAPDPCSGRVALPRLCLVLQPGGSGAPPQPLLAKVQGTLTIPSSSCSSVLILLLLLLLHRSFYR